jgi:hypothetical protein
VENAREKDWKMVVAFKSVLDYCPFEPAAFPQNQHHDFNASTSLIHMELNCKNCL